MPYIRKKIKNISNKEWVTLISLAAGHIAVPILLGNLPNFNVGKELSLRGTDGWEPGPMMSNSVVSHTLQTGIAMVLFHKLASAMSTDSTEDEENEA
jgi:hypothetical protein